MDCPLLEEIVIVFALSIGVILLCLRLKLPTIIGFLLTGVICGPHALGLVHAGYNVEILSEIGIVLLLFGIGMEFSLSKILAFKRFFFGGGGLQVVLTSLGGFIIGQLFGRPLGESLFIGFLLSMSSTAIIIKLQNEKGEGNAPHSLLNIGILIFQDIVAVPMLILTSVLVGKADTANPDTSFLLLLAKGLIVIGVVFFLAIKIVPKVLYYIAKTRSKELFLLAVLTIGFLVAWLASAVGLSLSLGAFLAGLIVSETEFSHEAVADILPFQTIFTSFFFISTGMLLNIEFLIHHPLAIFAAVLGFMLLKAVCAISAGILIGMPMRTAILSGIMLSQVGEFSFVLAQNGVSLGAGDATQYPFFLSVALITMILSPALVWLAPKFANLILGIPIIPTKLKSGLKPIVNKAEAKQTNHVIIIGFGVSGKNVARAAKQAGIPYSIIEMNPETVRTERLHGEPIHFGDATHDSMLMHVNIKDAYAVAIVINDPSAVGRIVTTIRQLNPKVYLIVRTRFVQEMKPMFQLGVDDVIPDEFGSSIEVLTRILRKYQTPTEVIENCINTLRIDGYEMHRLRYREPTAYSDFLLNMQQTSIETCRLEEASPLAGKTLIESELRKKYGITVMQIKRHNGDILKLNGDTMLLPNDLLVLVGAPENLQQVRNLAKPPAS